MRGRAGARLWARASAREHGSNGGGMDGSGTEEGGFLKTNMGY